MCSKRKNRLFISWISISLTSFQIVQINVKPRLRQPKSGLCFSSAMSLRLWTTIKRRATSNLTWSRYLNCKCCHTKRGTIWFIQRTFLSAALIYHTCSVEVYRCILIIHFRCTVMSACDCFNSINLHNCSNLLPLISERRQAVISVIFFCMFTPL